ncbi:MAG: tyrosine-type recombinase/integrase [Gemmatimonadaceae bacterium]
MARSRKVRAADHNVTGANGDPEAVPLPANADLARRYLLVRSGRLLKNSLTQYTESLGEFVTAIGPMPLADVEIDDVAAYFNVRTRDATDRADARRWSPRTAAKHRSALNKFFRYLVKQRIIPANPVEDYELQRFRPAEPVIIGNEAFDTLFRHIESKITTSDDRIAALYILDATVLGFMDGWGVRVTEATSVFMSDVVLERNELYARLRQKANKVKPYPITGHLLGSYMRWLRVRARVTKRPGHEDFLFVHPWTGYRISRQRANKRLRRLALDAGLDEAVVERLTPHKLRHRFARNLLDAGEDLTAVQSALNHQNIATTAIYLSDDEAARLDVLRRAVRRERSKEA